MTSVADLRSKLELLEGYYETLMDFLSLKGKKKYKTAISTLLDDVDSLEREITDEIEEQTQHALSLLGDPSVSCTSCAALANTITDLFQISLEFNEGLREFNEEIFRSKYF